MRDPSRQVARLLRQIERRLRTKHELQGRQKKKESESENSKPYDAQEVPISIRAEIVNLPVEEIKQLVAKGHDEKWQQKHYSLNRWTLRVLTATLVMVSLQWFAMYGTLGEIQEQTNTLAESVKVAQGQLAEAIKSRETSEKSAGESMALSRRSLDTTIELSRTDQRAWLGLIRISPAEYVLGDKRVYIQSGHRLAVEAIIHNSGKTVARKVRFRAGSRIQRAGQEFEPVYGLDFTNTGVVQPEANFIIPTSRMTTAAGLPHPGYPDNVLQALAKDQLVLYIYGEVAYADVFGIDHVTAFCMFLQEDFTAFTSCRTYNDAN